MLLLFVGVVLWGGVHLAPSLATQTVERIRARLGANAYRGVFSLLIVLSLVLIVVGWRATPEVYLYILPPWSRWATFFLTFLAFVLLGATHYPTAIKRVVRHPMLAGVAVWALAHLLTNGTTRSLLLFGYLGVWALLEIRLINARDGEAGKPSTPGMAREIRGLLISAAVFAVFMWLHPYFAGVSPLPR